MNENNRFITKQNLIFIICFSAVLLLTSLVGFLGYPIVFPRDNENYTTADEKIDESDPFYGEDNITLKVYVPIAYQDYIMEQCSDFKELYPSKAINIKVVGVDDITGFITETEAPDVFFFSSEKIDQLIQAKMLLPIYSLANERAGISPEQIIAENSENSIAAATYDGKLFAFPAAADNGYVLFYDKSILSNEDIKTFEGIIEKCAENDKRFIMDAGKAFYSSMFLFTGGLSLEDVDEETDIQQLNDYNKSEVLDSLFAFNRLFSIYSDTFYSDEVDLISTGFGKGEVAAGIDGIWNLQRAKFELGDNFGIATIPSIEINGKNKQTVPFFEYRLIGVNSSSKWLESSQLLAAYLSGEKCQKERADKLKIAPTNIKAQKYAAKKNSDLAVLIKQSETSMTMRAVSTLYWSEINELGMKLSSTKEKSRKEVEALFDSAIKSILEG